jgi:hypothetical protein
MKFLDHTQRRTTIGMISPDELSAHRRDLYLTTHNIRNRQTPMPPVGFQPAIPGSERPQTHSLDRAAIGTCDVIYYCNEICKSNVYLYWWLCVHLLTGTDHVTSSNFQLPVVGASLARNNGNTHTRCDQRLHHHRVLQYYSPYAAMDNRHKHG